MEFRYGYSNNPDIDEESIIFLPTKDVDGSMYYYISDEQKEVIENTWKEVYGDIGEQYRLWIYFTHYKNKPAIPWFIISVCNKDHTIVTIKTKNAFLFNNVITGKYDLYGIENGKSFII